jgi:hypothetical protein
MRRGALTAFAVLAAACPAAQAKGKPAAAPPATHVAAAAGAAPATAQAARAPRVDVMVVGKSRVLLRPTRVTARAATVRVGGRRCAVAAATPLAVLVAARRAGGPSFALRDFGACSRSPRDSGGLFVRRIGREANRGRDGWTYKVGRRAGSAGAGDIGGPFGTGRRIAAGARVLWFWCRLGARGCQRTLALRAPATAAPGAPLTVTVSGHDDAGRGRAIAGATVALAGASAVTGRDGRATLTAPAATGRHTLSATAPGLVTGFPEQVMVR